MHFFVQGAESPLLTPQTITANDQTLHFEWTSDGKRGWVMVEVRDSDGHVILLGNPIYVNWDLKE